MKAKRQYKKSNLMWAFLLVVWQGGKNNNIWMEISSFNRRFIVPVLIGPHSATLRHSPLSNENNCTKLLAHWKHWQVFYSRDRDLTITVVRLSVCSSFHPSVSMCIIIAIITKQVLSSVLFYILHWFACRSDQLRLIKRQH